MNSTTNSDTLECISKNLTRKKSLLSAVTEKKTRNATATKTTITTTTAVVIETYTS